MIFNPLTMKTIIKITLSIIIIISGNSCVTYVPLTKELPPEISLDKEECNIGFVNLYDYQKLPYDNDKKMEVFKSGVQHFAIAFSNVFDEDPRFHVTFFDTLAPGQAKSRMDSIIEPETIEIICSDNKVDYLFTLEAYDIYFDKEVDVEKNDDGSKTKTAHFYLNIYGGMRLYNKNGKLIKQSELLIDQYYKSRQVASSILAIDPFIKNAGEEVDQLSMELADLYFAKFNPSVIMQTKEYFTGKDFKESKEYFDLSEWDKVIEILLPLTQSGDEKIAYKAANNLSVVYEVMGNNEMAEKWKNTYETLRYGTQ